MKNIITFLLLFGSIVLQAQTIKEYELKYSLSDFTLTTDERNLTSITSKRSDFILKEDPSLPALPYFHVNILIPEGRVLNDFSVVETTSILRQNVTLAPNPQLLPTNVVSTQQSVVSLPTYSHLKYPDKNIELVSINRMGDYTYASFEICPFIYHAQTKELSFISNIVFSISLGTTTALRSGTTPQLRNETMESIVKFLVINPEETTHFQPQSMMISSEEPNLHSIQYLIVTAGNLVNRFQALADWKTKKGVPAKIVSLEEIYAAYPGDSRQQKIKACLYDYYQNKNIKWVLLGGDNTIVPAQPCYGYVWTKNGPLEDKTIPTDLFYACFDNNFNWDSNKNGIMGETGDNIDMSPELYLSRLPVRTSGDVDAIVSKILRYELQPNVGNVNQLLLAGTKLGAFFDGGVQSDTHHYSETMYSQYIQPYWPGVKRKLYDTGTDFPGNGSYELNTANLHEQLNNGYHFVHMGAHGGNTNWGLEYGNYRTTDALSLNNHSSSVITTIACLTNAFDDRKGSVDPCLSEAFIRNPNGGAVVYWGCSREGWYSEGSKNLGPSYQYDSQFYKNLFSGAPSSDKYKFGYIGTKAKAYFVPSSSFNDPFRWIQFGLNLIGDPEMPIWTNTPQTLQDSIFPQTITTGENTVTVTIGNLPAGEKAFICLQKENEVYEVKTVTQNGSYPIVVTPRTAGTMDVTVTAHNFIPSESAIQVNAGQLPSLFIEDIVVKDDRAGSSIGNNNGKIEAGEKIELSIKLKNGGLSAANNVSASLTSLCQDIAVNTTQSSYGNISSGAINESLTKYVFTVDKGAIERMKDDSDPALFQLTITDSGSRTYTDVFKVDLFAPEISQRNKIESTTNGDKTIQAGETVWIQIELTNTGGADATGLTAVLSTTSSYVTSCSSTPRTYPVIKKNETKASTTAFEFKVSSAYTSTALPLNFTLLVQNEFGKTWTYNFDLANRLPAIPVSSIKSVAYLNEIELYWTHQTGAAGYNIYRSDVNAEGSPVGNYIKANDQPVVSAYFRDYGLSQLTKYVYRIAAVSSSGAESELSPAFLAWTSYPTKGLFPITMNGEGLSSKASPIIVSDVNCDGNKEIFTTFTTGDSGIGLIEAVQHDGTELFDIDNNVTTYAGFARYDVSMVASVAIGDLYGTGEFYSISATRNYYGARNNYVTCHSMYDKDGDNKPDVVWQYSTPYCIITSPTLANLDNSSDGSLEVVLRPDGNAGVAPIIVLDSNGNELYRFGESNPYSAVAVADLDNDGDMEIIAGYKEGIYIWHHDGRNFTSNPVFNRNASTYSFHSSPTICDIDGDGKKEILVSSISKSSGNGIQSVIYAINPDGTLVNGWNGTQVSSVKGNTSSQEVVVGDLDSDGNLEVVVAGTNHLRIWNKNGILLKSIPFDGGPGEMRFPILADVDGDNKVEIVAHSIVDPKVFAFKPDGNVALGFPLDIKTVSNSTLCVADVDNNGRNEVIISGGNQIYMWETAGNPELIEWGMGRSNPHNTGEYKSYCDPVIVKSNTTWSGNKDICGNLIVHSGTLTLDANATLTMRPSTFVIVKAGASLVVDGGKVLNTSIKALPGSNLILKNDGLVKLSKKGEFSVFEGAIFDYQMGNIDITTD